MTTTLNKLIYDKSKEFEKIYPKKILSVGNYRKGHTIDLKLFLSTAIQEGYELAIKDVEKIIGKNEEYSQSGYFKEDNGEIITNDEIQGMNILKNELRLKLQLLLKESK